MKKSFTLSALLVLLMAAFSMSSCSKSNEVEDVIGIMKEWTEKVKETPANYDSFGTVYGDKLDAFQESAVELTPEQLSQLKSAFAELLMANIQAEYGFDPAELGLSVDDVIEASGMSFDSCKTVGEFITAVANAGE